MRVLVTGGAGFIGSHVVLALAEAGHHPITVDDLSNGHRDAVTVGEFHQSDIRDEAALTALLASARIDTVIHLAGLIEAGLSVRTPERFHAVNVGGTAALLNAVRNAGIGRVLFASTAAVYGDANTTPLREDSPLGPFNPYGETKLASERLLAEAGRRWGLVSLSFRFFNAAGADPKGRLSERHAHESHLIPLALEVAAGRRPHLSLFGNDYPTPDGTCIRDYVHVSDLAAALLAGLTPDIQPGEALRFNVGSGRGYSVREVIAAVEKVSGRPLPVRLEPRRLGDPARLTADDSAIRAELGWQPRFPDLEDMVRHAWRAREIFTAPSASG